MCVVYVYSQLVKLFVFVFFLLKLNVKYIGSLGNLGLCIWRCIISVCIEREREREMHTLFSHMVYCISPLMVSAACYLSKLSAVLSTHITFPGGALIGLSMQWICSGWRGGNSWDGLCNELHSRRCIWLHLVSLSRCNCCRPAMSLETCSAPRSHEVSS